MINIIEEYMSKAKYVISKIDNSTYCQSNGHFTRHLRDNNLTYQEYYEKHYVKRDETF